AQVQQDRARASGESVQSLDVLEIPTDLFIGVIWALQQFNDPLQSGEWCQRVHH
ncbi:MAG: hypothetical protein HW385_476, partial [candidate division NC10 bacterium]|nr:hypothetical protein [candidate division NC10 bacterium]